MSGLPRPRVQRDAPVEEKRAALPPKPTRKLAAAAAEFTVNRADMSSVLCETFIFDPDRLEEPLGSLYMVLETVNLSSKTLTVLESIATAIRREYYREPERDMLTSFESALAQANHVIGELAEQGESDWADHFHAAVVVFHEQTLHVTRSGSAELLLVRSRHLSDIGEGLSDAMHRRPLHPFAHVASGTVAEHDELLLATPQLFHLLPRDRLLQFVQGKNPAQTVALLRSLLEDSRESADFSLLVLQFSRAPERLPAPEVPRTIPPRTAATLRADDSRRPTIRPRHPIPVRTSLIRRIGRITVYSIARFWQWARRRAFPVIRAGARRSAHAGSAVARKAGHTVRGTITSWRTTPGNKATSPSRIDHPALLRGYTAPETLSRVTRLQSRLRALPRAGAAWALRTVRGMPKSAKIFSLLTIILAVLFVGSLVALSRKRQEDTAVRAALELLQEARAKKEGADAALIYENFDQARQLLRESRAAAQDVEKTPYYHDESAALLGGLQETEDRIEKVTRVSDPKIIGDFASVAPSLRSPGMATVGNGIFTFSQENNAIYRINTDTGEATVVSQTSQGVGYFRAAHAFPAEKTILFSTDSPGLALFDTERGDVLKREIKLPEGVKTISAIGTFGSRLYLLAPEQRMVYGYAKTLAGYEGGTPWLKDAAVPIDRAVAMGIDGYMYLLLRDGSIVKLLKGVPVEFKQAPLTTPVLNPTRLIITEELKHLYVLDPEQKRVLVYDTVGNLTRQLVLPNAKDLRDIAVKGKEEALYILDETRVALVPLK